jgi:hypothetical protein
MSMDTEYDILQDKITELLQNHQEEYGALDAVYRRAIERDIMAMVDADTLSTDDIDQAIDDLVKKLGGVTDNAAYRALDNARGLVEMQQYFFDKHGYSINLEKEYDRLRAIQANTFDAFAGIPKDTGETIRTMLRDNEVMRKGKAAINTEIERIAGVTASRAELISGTSEFLYVGKFNANKAKDLGCKKFRYKPAFVIPTSRPFSRWAVAKGTFTKEEIAAIDAKDWLKVPGIPLDSPLGWQGMIPDVPVLVQGGGYNTIHRFAMVFLDGPEPKVTQPFPPNSLTKDDDGITVPVKPVVKKLVVNLDGVHISGAQKHEYEAIFIGTPEEIELLINKYPKVKIIEKRAADGKTGYYRRAEEKIVADPSARDGRTFRHEYGHHVDNVLNPGSYRYLSETDKVFMDAFTTDRKRLGLDKTMTKSASLMTLHKRLFEPKVYAKTIKIQGVEKVEWYQKTTIKDETCAGISDIIDNMTSGYFRKNYPGVFGHSVKYYKDYAPNKYIETFANLFELRASKIQWELTKELFPDVVARFEKLITEAI